MEVGSRMPGYEDKGTPASRAGTRKTSVPSLVPLMGNPFVKLFTR
jgi:hypothetical protein